MKRNTLINFGTLAVTVFLAVVAAGCCKKSDSEPGIGEKTGVAVDHAASNVVEAAKNTADAAKEVADKAVDKTGEVLEKTGEAIKETGENMQK